IGVPVNTIRRNVRTSFTTRAIALFGFLLKSKKKQRSTEDSDHDS
ncbi:unnamed protein product, partial [Rotaria sp. Silwood1]